MCRPFSIDVRRRSLSSLLFFLLLIPSLNAGDKVSSDLIKALDEIGRKHYEVLRVGFGNFTYEYSPLGGSFSRFLEEELKTAINRSDYFELFVLDALENLDPAFKAVYGDLIGPEQVEALLRGRYFDEGGKVRVSLEVISFKTGYLVGKAEVMIDKKDIPEDFSLLPPDFEHALELDKEFEDVVGSS